jgi:hypothetical protein
MKMIVVSTSAVFDCLNEVGVQKKKITVIKNHKVVVVIKNHKNLTGSVTKITWMLLPDKQIIKSGKLHCSSTE